MLLLESACASSAAAFFLCENFYIYRALRGSRHFQKYHALKMKTSLFAPFQLLFFCPFWLAPTAFFAQNLDSLAVARAVDSLVQENRKHISNRDFDDAIATIELATQMAETAFGKDAPAYATCLANHGRTLFFMRDLKGAEPFCRQALAIRAHTIGQHHPDYIRNLNFLAVLTAETGRYRDAEHLYLRVLSLWEQVAGKMQKDYASAAYNLANLYDALDLYEQAEERHLEALAIREAVLGKQHLDYASSLNNLGNLYTHMGKYAQAEPFYQEALQIRAKLGDEHPDYLSTLNNQANLYFHLGAYDKAEALHTNIRTKREVVLGKEHSEYASTLNNLGIVHFMRGQQSPPEIAQREYALAAPFYQEALAVFEKTEGKSHISYASCLGNLAVLHYAAQQYDKAEQFHLEAMSAVERAFGKEHLEYAANLSNIALVYQAQRAFVRAEQCQMQALMLRKKILGEGSHLVATSLHNLARLYESWGMPHRADSCYLESSRIQRDLLQKSAQFLSEKEMKDFSATFEKNLHTFCSAAYLRAADNPALASASYDNALFYKGFLLSAAIQRRNWASRDPVASALEKSQKAERCYLAREYAKPLAERDAVRINQWEHRADSLEKELVRRAPTIDHLLAPIDWQAVQASLSDGSAAIEFISYRFQASQQTDSIMYAALILRPGDAAPRFVPLFEERQLRALFERPLVSDKHIVADLYGNSPDLCRLFWQPLEPFLREAKTVYYAPAGLLYKINPAAIEDEHERPIAEGRQWVRLGSTRELATERLADQSFARASARENEGQPLTATIFGGIRYDMDSLAFAAANPLGAPEQSAFDFRKDGAFRYLNETPFNAGQRRGGYGETAWEPLPATEAEADSVEKSLRRAGFTVIVRKRYEASEDWWKKTGTTGSSIGSPYVAHFATHGFSYPDPPNLAALSAESAPVFKLANDPMLRSGLLLAGSNFYWKNKRPLGNWEDGVLVAYEVQDMNLENTELVVLSACQTGLGDVSSTEGIYGLQRAFHIAGAKFLVASLWEVPDEATQEMMAKLYENWAEKGEPMRDAFAHAQEAMKQKFQHPFLWSGFVLIE